jgi:hypothetical protein
MYFCFCSLVFIEVFFFGWLKGGRQNRTVLFCCIHFRKYSCGYYENMYNVPSNMRIFTRKSAEISISMSLIFIV